MTRGHAMEVRINSEDPDHDFRPSPGKITMLNVPAAWASRWDSARGGGLHGSPNYDSLVGKLIVHAPSRLEAIATMRRALDELVIEGIQTTIPLHRRIFRKSRLHRRTRRHHLARTGPDAREGESKQRLITQPLEPEARVNSTGNSGRSCGSFGATSAWEAPGVPTQSGLRDF